MKTLVVVAGFVSLSLLAGCAPAPLTKADVDGRIVCDTDRMTQAERQALKASSSTRLVWVNCPQAVLRPV